MKINKTISIDYELWTAFELYCKNRNWKYSNAIEMALEQIIIGRSTVHPNNTPHDKKG